MSEERVTATGRPPEPGLEDASAPASINPSTGQHRDHWVLSAEERAKGFVRPVRDSYVHDSCGSVTEMGRAIAETYARQPSFYGSTFCVACRGYYPVSEFVWDGTQERVGS